MTTRKQLEDMILRLEGELSKNPTFIELQVLKEALLKLTNNVINPLIKQNILVTGQNGYPVNGSNIGRAIWALSTLGGSATTKQIVDEMMKYEPEGTKRAVLMGAVSSVLGTKAKTGKTIGRTAEEGKETVYYLI